MMKNIPIVSTVIVVASALTMVALGIWQLGRAEEKNAMIASYSAAQSMAQPVAWPRIETDLEENLFRRSELVCERVIDRRATAGTSDNGTKGWAQVARCALEGGGEAEIVLGWTRAPTGPQWTGGTVSGLIAPGPKLIADPPRAALTALAKPDPQDLPNNHLAYAGQWFFFALTALVIYVLALRRRREDG